MHTLKRRCTYMLILIVAAELRLLSRLMIILITVHTIIDILYFNLIWENNKFP